jgi:hypothetical protein
VRERTDLDHALIAGATSTVVTDRVAATPPARRSPSPTASTRTETS